MAISLLPLCSVTASALSLPSNLKSRLPNPSVFPNFSSFQLTHSPVDFRRKTCSATGNGSSKDESAAAFLDENGVVEDMDAYLNHLSLEYDSVWDTKPSWCQPWTITLTGVLIISFSWLILHSALATAVVATLISAWWYLFLYSYPKGYSAMIAERRRKVTNGVEDTYGVSKNQ